MVQMVRKNLFKVLNKLVYVVFYFFIVLKLMIKEFRMMIFMIKLLNIEFCQKIGINIGFVDCYS